MNSNPAYATGLLTETNETRILYADDTLLCRRLMATALAYHGFFADFAVDGEEAFEMMESMHWKYSLLITDHEMPRLDGRGLVNKLSHSPYRGRFCVSSSLPYQELEYIYRDFRVDVFLPKPFTMADLRQTLDVFFPWGPMVRHISA
jgi:two-component system chemotaxis response regulator CheY